MDYANLKQLEFRRKFWKIAGAEIYVAAPGTTQEVGYIQMKAWKLREDIRLFTTRSMEHQIMQIHARQIIDFGATYDVTDAHGKQVFSMRRKGFKSAFVRDHWDLLDNNGDIFGEVQETSSGLALARRWLEVLPFGELIALAFSFVPQTYNVSIKRPDSTLSVVATITHQINPVVVKMTLDTSMATVPVNQLVPLASASMLSVVDATKN